MHGKMQRQGSLKSFPWYIPQLSGVCILYSHILSFFRTHRGWGVTAVWCLLDNRYFSPSWVFSRFTLGGCNHWWMTQQEIFHFSDPFLLVRNLTNIWEIFVKMLDMPLPVLIFGLELIGNWRFSVSSNYSSGDIFPCCFFPYLKSWCYNYFLLYT